MIIYVKKKDKFKGEKIMPKEDYVIKSNDPQALEKLGERLTKEKNYQEFMKTANAYYRNNGTLQGLEGVEQEWVENTMAYINKLGHSEPYPSWMLQNNLQGIKRTEERIQRVEYEQNVGFNGWEFNGGKAIANKEDNRLKLLFNEKPNEETIATLKKNGFHWSPSSHAWQRQLTQNAISTCDRLGFVKPTDGRRPSEHQPKLPQKNDLER